MSKRCSHPVCLIVLKELMLRDNVGTSEICNKYHCERKAVYSAIDTLECAGFPIEITKDKGEAKYTWNKQIMYSAV